MSLKIPLKGIFEYLTLSKMEVRMLDTIQAEKSGNVYSLWKASRLKHYPTVLRTLKKLEKKGLVKISGEKGARGEIIYSQTFAGVFVSYMCNGKENEIVKMVVDNSSLLRELLRVERDKSWALSVARDIITDAYTKEKPRSIDEVIKDKIEDLLTDYAINPLDEGNVEWIVKVSEVKWVRRLAVRIVDDEINYFKKQVEELEKVRKTLTTK